MSIGTLSKKYFFAHDEFFHTSNDAHASEANNTYAHAKNANDAHAIFQSQKTRKFIKNKGSEIYIPHSIILLLILDLMRGVNFNFGGVDFTPKKIND